MALSDITFLVYSHTDYDDVLNIYLHRHKKYFSEINVTICTNNKSYVTDKYSKLFDNIDCVIQYDDTHAFGEKLHSVINQIKTKYIIFQQEINVFIDKVNVEKIIECLKFIEENNVDQLRLIVSGVNNPIFNDKLIHKLESGYIFSVYPGIWKTSTLLDITSKFNYKVYRDFECEEVHKYVSQYNNYYMSNSKDKYMNPWWFALWIPEYYPICHVLTGGKWFNSTDLYKSLINDIFNEFNIDITKRGTTC